MRLQDTNLSCATCKYFYWDGDMTIDDTHLGYCLRFPPVYIGKPKTEKEYDETSLFSQPAVDPETTVCGEWISNKM